MQRRTEALDVTGISPPDNYDARDVLPGQPSCKAFTVLSEVLSWPSMILHNPCPSYLIEDQF